MARHTKMKIAALATTLVAALGMAAISPATASHAEPRAVGQTRWFAETRSPGRARSPVDAAALR
jgi:hypothetical protein